MGVKSLVKQALSQKENIKYRSLLAGRKGSYSQWLERQKLLWQEENERILPGRADDSGFVFICASEGVLTVYARKSIACFFIQHPEVQLLYGDEDLIDAKGVPRDPYFKPDWSPDLLDGCFYFGSIVAMRKDFFEKAAEGLDAGTLLQTVKRNDYMVTDFKSYIQWVYRCVELAGGYRRGSCGIGHVSQILFHGSGAMQELFYRHDMAGLQNKSEGSVPELRQEVEGCGDPAGFLVTVVVPSRDHPELLAKCLQAVRDAGEGLRLEVIVVDNGSTADNKEKTEELVGTLAEEYFQVTYLYRPMEFHFSRMCNLGAEAARGRFLLFLNDDVELAVKGCVERMAALAARPYTGAVGMKLYYPQSEKIQHAGITNLPMGPVHKLQFHENGKVSRYVSHSGMNYLAVTAACLMVEREKFREAGEFAEELRVAFNDVDLCFRLYEAGYHNVCIHDCHAYHHESLSRGGDESVDGLERLLEERDRLYGNHPGLVGKDPYYSVHLNREGLDTMIRPAYETMGNCVQEYARFLAEKTLYDYRRDECVMVRVEAVQSGEIYGWSVVLGDNNACYEKSLILKRVRENFLPEADEWFRGPSDVMVIPLKEQYRPDLEENMPDQVNVALSGFHVRLKGNLLPPGRYRIGAAARHRITGAGLANWSNRFILIQ